MRSKRKCDASFGEFCAFHLCISHARAAWPEAAHLQWGSPGPTLAPVCSVGGSLCNASPAKEIKSASCIWSRAITLGWGGGLPAFTWRILLNKINTERKCNWISFITQFRLAAANYTEAIRESSPLIVISKPPPASLHQTFWLVSGLFVFPPPPRPLPPRSFLAAWPKKVSVVERTLNPFTEQRGCHLEREGTFFALTDHLDWIGLECSALSHSLWATCRIISLMWQVWYGSGVPASGQVEELLVENWGRKKSQVWGLWLMMNPSI